MMHLSDVWLLWAFASFFPDSRVLLLEDLREVRIRKVIVGCLLHVVHPERILTLVAVFLLFFVDNLLGVIGVALFKLQVGNLFIQKR